MEYRGDEPYGRWSTVVTSAGGSRVVCLLSPLEIVLELAWDEAGAELPVEAYCLAESKTGCHRDQVLVGAHEYEEERLSVLSHRLDRTFAHDYLDQEKAQLHLDLMIVCNRHGQWEREGCRVDPKLVDGWRGDQERVSDCQCHLIHKDMKMSKSKTQKIWRLVSPMSLSELELEPSSISSLSA